MEFNKADQIVAIIFTHFPEYFISVAEFFRRTFKIQIIVTLIGTYPILKKSNVWVIPMQEARPAKSEDP
jgi:hypothetical protein